MNVGYECSSYFKFCVHLKFFIIKISGRTEILISLHLLFFFSFLLPQTLSQTSPICGTLVSPRLWALSLLLLIYSVLIREVVRGALEPDRGCGNVCPPIPCMTTGPLTLNSAAHFPGPIGLVWGGKNNGRGMCKWLEEGLEYWEPSTGFSHD